MVKKLTILNVLEPFLSRPDEELHLAEISRELKEPHPTVRLHLKDLEKKGVLKKKYKGRLTLYSLKFECPLLVDYITVAEKNKLIRKCSENLVLKELISVLHANFSECDIVIFGSATEDFKKANDVDIFVVGKIDKKSLENFEFRYNKPIHLNKVDELEEVTDLMRDQIVKKHIIINGSEKIIRWLYWKNLGGAK